MHNRHRLSDIFIKPESFIFLAFSVLFLPICWILAWLVASVFHEVCHYVALKIFDCEIYRIQIGLDGALIDTNISGNIKEFICALAGPIGGLFLLAVGKWWPRLAVCAFLQSAYNLIPIYPLDGGRAVHSLLPCFCSEPYRSKIELVIQWSVQLLSLFFGLYAAIYLKVGLLPLIFAGILIVKNYRGKCTCKECFFGVK